MLFMVYIVVVGSGLWVVLAMFKFVGMGGYCRWLWHDHGGLLWVLDVWVS